MSALRRYVIYGTVIAVYIIFGLLEGWYDIFPWGAVIIGVCILISEIGTRMSINNRNR
jgi:hypothetical protein